MNDFYTEDDAQQILRLALNKDTMAGGVSGVELRTAAAEMGVTAEALAAAEEQWLTEGKRKRDIALFSAERKRGFVHDLATYAIVNAVLVYINLRSGGHFWAVYPILLGGIAILLQAVETFDRKSERYRKEFAKWQRKQEKRAQEARAD